MVVCITSISAPNTVLANQSFQIVVVWKNFNLQDIRAGLAEFHSDTYTFKNVKWGTIHYSQPKDSTGEDAFTVTAPSIKGRWYLRAKMIVFSPTTKQPNRWVGTDYKDFVLYVG